MTDGGIGLGPPGGGGGIPLEGGGDIPVEEKVHNQDDLFITEATQDPDGILANPVKITASAETEVTNKINIGDVRWTFQEDGDGSMFGTGPSQQLSLWGATPTTQYGDGGGVAGGGDTVKDNSAYDGGTGTTAYTIGDIVKALKLMGVLTR